MLVRELVAKCTAALADPDELARLVKLRPLTPATLRRLMCKAMAADLPKSVEVLCPRAQPVPSLLTWAHERGHDGLVYLAVLHKHTTFRWKDLERLTCPYMLALACQSVSDDMAVTAARRLIVLSETYDDVVEVLLAFSSCPELDLIRAAYYMWMMERDRFTETLLFYLQKDMDATSCDSVGRTLYEAMVYNSRRREPAYVSDDTITRVRRLGLLHPSQVISYDFLDCYWCYSDKALASMLPEVRPPRVSRRPRSTLVPALAAHGYTETLVRFVQCGVIQYFDRDVLVSGDLHTIHTLLQRFPDMIIHAEGVKRAKVVDMIWDRVSPLYQFRLAGTCSMIDKMIQVDAAFGPFSLHGCLSLEAIQAINAVDQATAPEHHRRLVFRDFTRDPLKFIEVVEHPMYGAESKVESLLWLIFLCHDNVGYDYLSLIFERLLKHNKGVWPSVTGHVQHGRIISIVGRGYPLHCFKMCTMGEEDAIYLMERGVSPDDITVNYRRAKDTLMLWSMGEAVPQRAFHAMHGLIQPRLGVDMADLCASYVMLPEQGTSHVRGRTRAREASKCDTPANLNARVAYAAGVLHRGRRVYKCDACSVVYKVRHTCRKKQRRRRR